jgi:hypothetical protein
MALMHCPHCGAENFTMEGWEDVDHCSSCGKPLGEPNGNAPDASRYEVRRNAQSRGRHGGDMGQGAQDPRRA